MRVVRVLDLDTRDRDMAPLLQDGAGRVVTWDGGWLAVEALERLILSQAFLDLVRLGLPIQVYLQNIQG